MKTALVTGAGGGIGAAICRLAAAQGYGVVAWDVDLTAAQDVAATLSGAQAIAVDVADEAAVDAAVQQLPHLPDVVVNNAGIGRFGPLQDLPVADFRRVVEVNLVGAYIVSRAMARRWLAAGRGGVIISLTSINAVHPAPNVGAYAAAKAGIAMLTEQMALEWGPHGIRANAVAPGFVDAGMSSPFLQDPAVRALRSGGVPLKRLATADDVAQAVMFLASDQASYISGHQLVVDGGVINSVLVQLPREKPKS